MYNEDQNLIKLSYEPGNADEFISADLCQGTYYVRTKKIGDGETTYNLNLIAGNSFNVQIAADFASASYAFATTHADEDVNGDDCVTIYEDLAAGGWKMLNASDIGLTQSSSAFPL